MRKTAQHHHALGADLQDLLLEDEEKVAVLGGHLSSSAYTPSPPLRRQHTTLAV